jgi:hypothetical protein
VRSLAPVLCRLNYIYREMYQTNPKCRDEIAGIDEFVGNMLWCYWQCQKTTIFALSQSSRTELENPIILYEASRVQSFIPIPRIFCKSPAVNHHYDIISASG